MMMAKVICVQMVSALQYNVLFQDVEDSAQVLGASLISRGRTPVTVRERCHIPVIILKMCAGTVPMSLAARSQSSADVQSEDATRLR